MGISAKLMEAIAATTVANPTALYRLYNTLAKKYFPSDMPAAGRDVHIIASPLQVQQKIGEGWFEGVDANGMVTSPLNSPILLFVNPFLTRYPRLMYIVMAHEMVHVYCHWQYRQTKDLRWLDSHGPRFHKVVVDVIGKGLDGIKPSQDIVQLPHSYPVLKGHALTDGYVYLRLDGYNELTREVLKQFAEKCKLDKPYYIGEMNTSIISIFPFVEDNKIVGEFFAYGEDGQLQLRHEQAYNWDGSDRQKVANG